MQEAVTVEKEDATDAWTALSIMTVLFFVILAVVIFLACYISQIKKKHQATLQFL